MSEELEQLQGQVGPDDAHELWDSAEAPAHQEVWGRASMQGEGDDQRWFEMRSLR